MFLMFILFIVIYLYCSLFLVLKCEFELFIEDSSCYGRYAL